MKLGRLIEILEDAREAYGDDVVVKIAEQPNYPFEYSIAGVAFREDLKEDQDGEPVTLRDHQGAHDLVLVAGVQLGYTDKGLWDVAQR